MKAELQQLIEMIPEDTSDEALASIECIVTYPADNRARLRCIMSSEFRIFIEPAGDGAVIAAEGRTPVRCTKTGFVSALKRTIYEIDEALAEGTYTQCPANAKFHVSPPPAPPEMDIPVWGNRTGQWYDAEY